MKTQSNIVTLYKTAQGTSDSSAVQAARRLLEKRGYDWETGKKLI